MTLEQYKVKYLTNLQELEGRKNLDQYEKYFVETRKQRCETFFSEVLPALEKFMKLKVEYLDFVDKEEDYNEDIVKILSFIKWVKNKYTDVDIFVRRVYDVDYNKFEERAKESLPTWELKKIIFNHKWSSNREYTTEDWLRGKD